MMNDCTDKAQILRDYSQVVFTHDDDKILPGPKRESDGLYYLFT